VSPGMQRDPPDAAALAEEIIVSRLRARPRSRRRRRLIALDLVTKPRGLGPRIVADRPGRDRRSRHDPRDATARRQPTRRAAPAAQRRQTGRDRTRRLPAALTHQVRDRICPARGDHFSRLLKAGFAIFGLDVKQHPRATFLDPRGLDLHARRVDDAPALSRERHFDSIFVNRPLCFVIVFFPSRSPNSRKMPSYGIALTKTYVTLYVPTADFVGRVPGRFSRRVGQ
jgi:hypothetical protein